MALWLMLSQGPTTHTRGSQPMNSSSMRSNTLSGLCTPICIDTYTDAHVCTNQRICPANKWAVFCSFLVLRIDFCQWYGRNFLTRQWSLLQPVWTMSSSSSSSGMEFGIMWYMGHIKVTACFSFQNYYSLKKKSPRAQAHPELYI